MALLLAGGSRFSIPKLRIKDELEGVTYNSLDRYLNALQLYIKKEIPQARDGKIFELTKKCLRGDSLPPQLKQLHCSQPARVFFTHIVIAILDAEEPFFVHFYGDENFNFLKPSIRVETLESYLTESRFSNCSANILTLTENAENRIYEFIKSGYAKLLLAPGNRDYNLLSNPWKTKSQNCNIWLSEVLASSLFLEKKNWPSANRQTALSLLQDTDFRPIKVVLTGLQSWMQIASLFIGGVELNEGNVFMHLRAADTVPARSITEWLNRLQLIQNSTTIKGTF